MENSKCFLVLLILSVAFNIGVEGKVYDRCEFVRTLRNLGVPWDQISTWTCIANFESHFNTQAINTNTWDYGILQISSIYWCSNSNTPGNGCHITCGQLLGDDISLDVNCARTVFDSTARISGNGFSAWTTWAPYCSGNNDGWIAGC